MTMIAYIINTDCDQISGDMPLADDSEFADVERMAKKYAREGIITREGSRAGSCAIMWRRQSDGQVGYWGPTGACMSAYWY